MDLWNLAVSNMAPPSFPLAWALIIYFAKDKIYTHGPLLF